MTVYEMDKNEYKNDWNEYKMDVCEMNKWIMVDVEEVKIVKEVGKYSKKSK